MTGPLPVKGSEISSAPCSVRKAARMLRRFLSSEAALEVGIARGYVEAVAQSLEEILARGKDDSGNGTEGLRSATAGRSSKFFNVEQVERIPEVKEKSRKEESKQRKREKAMVDFEALLGHELDVAEGGEQADGELGFEEKPAVAEMLPSTPRRVDSVDDGKESQKSEKQKKKKRKSVDGANMDVDMDMGTNGTQSSVKTEASVDSDPDNTKSAKKKKKKRKSLVDGVTFDSGLVSSPAKKIMAEETEAGVARAEDENMKPVDDDVNSSRKKKKKQRGDTSHGATPMKGESKKVLTEHMNSIILGDEGSNENGSGVQPQCSVKKKSKKRSSEVSPGNSEGQHRKSKKSRLSD